MQQRRNHGPNDARCIVWAIGEFFKFSSCFLLTYVLSNYRYNLQTTKTERLKMMRTNFPAPIRFYNLVFLLIFLSLPLFFEFGSHTGMHLHQNSDIVVNVLCCNMHFHFSSHIILETSPITAISGLDMLDHISASPLSFYYNSHWQAQAGTCFMMPRCQSGTSYGTIHMMHPSHSDSLI